MNLRDNTDLILFHKLEKKNSTGCLLKTKWLIEFFWSKIFVKCKQVKTKLFDITNISGIVQVPCNILHGYRPYKFSFQSNWQSFKCHFVWRQWFRILNVTYCSFTTNKFAQQNEPFADFTSKSKWPVTFRKSAYKFWIFYQVTHWDCGIIGGI